MLRRLTAALLTTIALAVAPSAGADTLPAIQGITFVKPLKIASRVGHPQNAQIAKRDIGKQTTCGLLLSHDKENDRAYSLAKGTHLALIKDPMAEKAQTRPQGPVWMWRIELGDKGLVMALGCSGMGNVPFKELQNAFADLMVIEPAK
jgi:hypothetical protein